MVSNHKGGRSRLVAVAVAVVVLVLLVALAPQAADASSSVGRDQDEFETSTGAQPVPFPADADTALAGRPYRGLVGYSCTDAETGIDLGEVTVVGPGATGWICFLDADWNAEPGNIDPWPDAATIVAGGEDDFLLRLDEPASSVGIGLLTNASANERITLSLADGTSATYDEAALGTAPNRREFVGFTSPAGITEVTIDTDGGRWQNTGITSISIGRAIEVEMAVRPGDRRNCVNPRARGVVPVALLGADSFDPDIVDPASVTLVGASPRPNRPNGRLGTLVDVDADGHRDLRVRVSARGAHVADGVVEMAGWTHLGTPIHGVAAVCARPDRRDRAR